MNPLNKGIDYYFKALMSVNRQPESAHLLYGGETMENTA